MKRLFRAAVGDPPRLVALLVARLRINTADANALLREGRVELNGKRAHDRDVVTGDRITVFVPDDAVEATPLRVAYRDDEVVVIDKPAGMRSQAVRGDAASDLIGRVQRDIDTNATLLHRLDRDTSGLIIFPLSNRARFRLQRDLDAGKISRRYVALVEGSIDAPQDIALRIGRTDDSRKRVALPENDPNGEAARTHVEPLRCGDRSLVQLTLDTGRTHQLRVHLSATGHPIVGDALYGGPIAPRLMLHADQLVFPDIGSGRLRTIVSPADELFATV